jgi:hypothetical protein
MLDHKQGKRKSEGRTNVYEVAKDIIDKMHSWMESVKSFTAQTESDIIYCLKEFMREQECKDQEAGASNSDSKNRCLPACLSKKNKKLILK